VQARFALEGGERRLFVRFEPGAKGSWKPAEWSIPSYPPEELRQIPFLRIQRAVQANEGVKKELAKRLGEAAEPGFRNAYGVAERGKPLTISRPKGRNLSDGFYASVAIAYKHAVGSGENPRQAIAEAAGVAADTAGRWIYEARKRQFIPKTTPGKVNA
jgi:hypothetical protein